MKPQPPERVPVIRLTQVAPIPVQSREGAPVTATMIVEVVAPSYAPYDFLWQAEQANVAPAQHEPRVTVTATPPVTSSVVGAGAAPIRGTLTTAHVTVVDIFGQTVEASGPVQYDRAQRPARQSQTREHRRWPLVAVAVLTLLALAGGGALLYGRHLLGGTPAAGGTATVGPGVLQIAPNTIPGHTCFDRTGDPVTLTLTNTGGQTLSYTATYTLGVVNSDSARTVKPPSGDIPAGGTTTLTVSGRAFGSATTLNSIDFTWTSAGVSHETQVFESCVQPTPLPTPTP
ncbi:MAG TPA: hypothetical protein VJN88_01380 [Ktedonobacterales bacterium]|nr:hypothetical protein [Ktedonobacterales bacterium]